MIRNSILSVAVSVLLTSVICAQSTGQIPPAPGEKSDLHAKIAQARKDEELLQKLLVKIEGDKLFCNGPWMKKLTNEEFDNIISKFQMNFSQTKLAEINGLRFLAERLQSEKPQLVRFEAEIALEYQNSKQKTSINDLKQGDQCTHIIDGDYQLYVDDDRDRVEIFKHEYPYQSYSLKNFRIPAAPWLFDDQDKFQPHSVVQMLDEDRYEITVQLIDTNSYGTLPTITRVKQQYRFNTKTRLVEEWKSYVNNRLTKRFLGIGEIEIQVQDQKSQQITSIWFPRYCLEFMCSRDDPSGICAQRIRSVELSADKVLDVTVPAREGTEVVIKLGGRDVYAGKMRQDIDDVLEIYSKRFAR